MSSNQSLLSVIILSVLASFFLYDLSVAAPNEGALQSETPALQQAHPQGAEVLKPDLPDLSLDFQVVAVQPGEPSVDGVTYPTKHLFFVWYVRNRGNAVSSPTTLKVSCTKEQAGSSDTSCPPGLTKDYTIYTLWPRPDDVSGCQVVWNSPSVPAPEQGVTYRFTAQVNPDRNIKEISYSNNVLNSHYKEGELRLLKAGQFQNIVAKEKTANRRASIGDIQRKEEKLIAKPKVTALLSSKITIQSISTQPAPLKANVPFDLTIQFLNAGNVPVNAGQQYSLSCRVISGGPVCPLPSGIKTINQSLQPGASHSAKFAGITGPAGAYDLSVKLLPEKPGEAARSFTIKINPERKLQNAPAPLPVKPSSPMPLKRLQR